jgi:DNA invertase Pin-like site-specific DNA recombinase
MMAAVLYRQEVERFCSSRGIHLGETFEDLDYSGWRGSRMRPGLEWLLERRREFSMIVVPKLSRFGRSLSHLCRLFDLFDGDGIALIFLDISLDTSTSQGRLLRNVMAAFAEYESDLRSEYSLASHRHMAAAGRPNGGQCPYGYRRPDRSSECAAMMWRFVGWGTPR